MARAWVTLALLGMMWNMCGMSASAQEQQPVVQTQNLQIQGKIVSTAPDHFVVQTSDNKQISVYVNPQSKFTMNNKAVSYADLKAGTSISAGYVMQGDKYYANTVVVAPAQAAPVQPAPGQAPQVKPAPQVLPAPQVQPPSPAPGQTQQNLQLQGRITKTGADFFVVQTPDNKQVTVYINPQTKFMLNNQAVLFSQLTVGTNISTQYIVQGDRFIASNVILTPAQAPPGPQPVPGQPLPPPKPGEGKLVQGEIVRVVGQDQVVIRTQDGKEVIIYLNPQTQYQSGQFSTMQPGVPIGVYYDVRDRRFLARRILFGPRR